MQNAIKNSSGFTDQYLIDRRSYHQDEMDRVEQELEAGTRTLDAAKLLFSKNYYMKMGIVKVLEDKLNPRILNDVSGAINNAPPSPRNNRGLRL